MCGPQAYGEVFEHRAVTGFYAKTTGCFLIDIWVVFGMVSHLASMDTHGKQVVQIIAFAKHLDDLGCVCGCKGYGNSGFMERFDIG